MVFEGSVTEPDYVDQYIRSLENRYATPGTILSGAGVPKTIVNTCVELKASVERESRKAGFPGLDEVWAIFDVDAHDLPDALLVARKNDIKCVISNPCFEVWGFLHAGRYDRPDGRHVVQRNLRNIMPKYHHEKNPKFDWEWCYPNIAKAIGHAEAGRIDRTKEGSVFPKDVPSTNFDRLLGVFSQDAETHSKTVKTWCEW
jgi:hypothetical protein